MAYVQVEARDLGNNFLLDAASLGSSRAQSTTHLLQVTSACNSGNTGIRHAVHTSRVPFARSMKPCWQPSISHLSHACHMQSVRDSIWIST